MTTGAAYPDWQRVPGEHTVAEVVRWDPVTEQWVHVEYFDANDPHRIRHRTAVYAAAAERLRDLGSPVPVHGIRRLQASSWSPMQLRVLHPVVLMLAADEDDGFWWEVHIPSTGWDGEQVTVRAGDPLTRIGIGQTIGAALHDAPYLSPEGVYDLTGLDGEPRDAAGIDGLVELIVAQARTEAALTGSSTLMQKMAQRSGVTLNGDDGIGGGDPDELAASLVYLLAVAGSAARVRSLLRHAFIRHIEELGATVVDPPPPAPPQDDDGPTAYVDPRPYTENSYDDTPF